MVGLPAAGSRVTEGAERGRRALSAVLGGFAVLTVLFSGVFPPFSNPNEISRFQMVAAAVDHGTFAIDSTLSLGDHEDRSISGGRTFSNKAPGLAFAAIPIYRLLRVALPAPVHGTSEAVFWIMRWLTVSLVCILALARLGRRLGIRSDPGPAALVVAAVAFGTPYLFYARSFFSHAWTAALLFLSWDLLKIAEERRSSRRVAALLLGAGFLAGWAAISEYPVALIALLLALRASAGRAWRSFALFGLGAAIPLALLAFYDTVCFGAPWVLSSGREAYPMYSELAATGLFGIGPPSARVALAFAFHPGRGVLFASPFFLWAIPGFWNWWRCREDRADCMLALSATLLFSAVMTGYAQWQGGWALGNRYLLPIVFFPALAIGRALAAPLSRGLFAAAVVFSTGTHGLLTSSWPYFPDDIPWPAAAGSSWFLARGWIAPGVLSGIPWGGVAALALSILAIALPLGLCLRAAGPLSPRPALCLLMGLAPLAGILLSHPEPGFAGQLWRAAVYGAYSGNDPGREELRQVALSAATPRQQRQAMAAWKAYGPR